MDKDAQFITLHGLSRYIVIKERASKPVSHISLTRDSFDGRSMSIQKKGDALHNKLSKYPMFILLIYMFMMKLECIVN